MKRTGQLSGNRMSPVFLGSVGYFCDKRNVAKNYNAAIHFRDLNAIFRHHPSVIEIDGQHLVNFTRCIKASALMNDLVQCGVPSLPQNPGRLAYLKSQLRNLDVHKRSNKDLDKRSRFLEREETRIHEMRSRELSSLGFRLSK
jgi:hypothetical protein